MACKRPGVRVPLAPQVIGIIRKPGRWVQQESTATRRRGVPASRRDRGGFGRGSLAQPGEAGTVMERPDQEECPSPSRWRGPCCSRPAPLSWVTLAAVATGQASRVLPVLLSCRRMPAGGLSRWRGMVRRARPAWCQGAWPRQVRRASGMAGNGWNALAAPSERSGRAEPSATPCRVCGGAASVGCLFRRVQIVREAGTPGSGARQHDSDSAGHQTTARRGLMAGLISATTPGSRRRRTGTPSSGFSSSGAARRRIPSRPGRLD
jgi:hypothetical protein